MIDSRAQSALEYLMTYGWTLIVVAMVVGSLVFIITPPEGVSFTSTDSELLLDQMVIPGGGTDSATLVLQNATGGSINVSALAGTGSFAASTGMTINGEDVPTTVDSGAEMLIEGIDTGGALTGGINITYQKRSGLQKTVLLEASGSLGGDAPPPAVEICNNSTDDDGDSDVDCDDTDCYADTACIVASGLVINTSYNGMTSSNNDFLMATNGFLFETGCGGTCTNYRAVFTDGTQSGNVYTISNQIYSPCWLGVVGCVELISFDVTTESPWAVGPWTYNIIKPHS